MRPAEHTETGQDQHAPMNTARSSRDQTPSNQHSGYHQVQGGLSGSPALPQESGGRSNARAVDVPGCPVEACQMSRITAYTSIQQRTTGAPGALLDIPQTRGGDVMRLNLTYFTGFKAPGSIGAFVACTL